MYGHTALRVAETLRVVPGCPDVEFGDLYATTYATALQLRDEAHPDAHTITAAILAEVRCQMDGESGDTEQQSDTRLTVREALEGHLRRLLPSEVLAAIEAAGRALDRRGSAIPPGSWDVAV
jgi:hypothetical protein